METSLAVFFKTKELLKQLKLHKRETFDEVINRLIEYYSKKVKGGNKK